MKLTIAEAARLLSVSEKEIYRWIKQGELPAYQVNDEYRLNQAELLEWATARKIACSPEIFSPGPARPAAPALSDALLAGGIHYDVPGPNKTAVLRAVVDLLRLGPDIDREFLFQVLLAREALGSTGIGEGIAIPHVRNPIVLHGMQPMVTLCFLRKPVDFGALDGQWVSILFTLVSPTVPTHLQLLSRLGYALRNAPFKSAVIGRAAPDTLMNSLRQLESALPPDRGTQPMLPPSD